MHQSQDQMIHSLCQKNFLTNFCMSLQLNFLIKNKTRWLVNHLQLCVNPLNLNKV